MAKFKTRINGKEVVHVKGNDLQVDITVETKEKPKEDTPKKEGTPKANKITVTTKEGTVQVEGGGVFINGKKRVS